MSSTLRSAFLKALRQEAEDCKADTLRTLLLKHASDEDAVLALKAGADDDYKSQDSGSYCENASPGYPNARQKQKLLRSFFARVNEFESLPVPSASTEIKLSPEQLAEEVVRLRRRIESLEQRKP